jgi:hypothetical protein
MTGKAAHIHAAAPGGRRYLASMTPEQRKDILNGIWLCASHSDLIDRDEITYTADRLREMKREHEAYCEWRHREAVRAGELVQDLIAVGPDIVLCGAFRSADDFNWSFDVEDFVEGDLYSLLRFIDRYEQTHAIDRYLLVNDIGDGRVLDGAPSVTKEKNGGYIVRCPVLPSAARIEADQLPTDLALSEQHDLTLTAAGDLAVVSGVEALPQRIKICLSTRKGEMMFHRNFGTRFAEYYKLFSGSPWFEHLLKLELIRQAAIPYPDSLSQRQETPLQCVERVFGIQLLADAPIDNWLPIRVDFQVKGIGRWQRELSICIPDNRIAEGAK